MPIKVKRNGAWVEVYGGAGGANNEEGIGTENFVIPIEHSLDNDSNDVYTLGETYSYSDLIAAINDGNEISCRITSKQSRSVILLPLIEYSMRAGHFKFSGLYNEQLITVTVANTNDSVSVEYINPNVNADWNQIDENASDYIKNKPFYKSQNWVPYVTSSAEITEKEKGIEIQTEVFFSENKTYRITYDGIEYDCVCTRYFPGNSSPFLMLGNPSCINSTYTNTGEPFAFKIVTYAHATLYFYGELGTHEVAIYNEEIEIVQLDEIYIPDTIARVEDLSQVQGGIVVTDKNSDGNIVISNLLSTSTYAENLSF